DRLRRHVGACEMGALVRPHLVQLARLQHPQLAINDGDWLKRGPTVFINARWLMPEASINDWTTPRVGLASGQVAFVVGSPGPDNEKLEHWLEACKKSLPQVQAGGSMIDYLWDLVDNNPATLTADWEWFHKQANDSGARPNVAVQGPADKLVIAEGASV